MPILDPADRRALTEHGIATLVSLVEGNPLLRALTFDAGGNPASLDAHRVMSMAEEQVGALEHKLANACTAAVPLTKGLKVVLQSLTLLLRGRDAASMPAGNPRVNDLHSVTPAEFATFCLEQERQLVSDPNNRPVTLAPPGALLAAAEARGIQSALDCTFAPPPSDDALWQEQMKHMHRALFLGKVWASSLKVIIVSSSKGNAPGCWRHAHHKAGHSASANLKASARLMHIVPMKLSDGKWRSTAKECVARWHKQACLYEALGPSACSTFSDAMKKQITQSALDDAPDFCNIRAVEQQTRKISLFENYKALALSATTTYDQPRAMVQRGAQPAAPLPTIILKSTSALSNTQITTLTLMLTQSAPTWPLLVKV